MRTHSNPLNKKLKTVAGLFLVSVSLVVSQLAQAQNTSISFESGSWEDIKAKSVKENKPIFLDAYASWCGICKKMDKNVFTNDSVAEYYNSHFINAKIEMETGEGPALANQYKVNVYPSLLFIDGQGKLLHRAVGGFKPQEFIELGKEAQHPDKQNSAKTNTQESTEGDEAVINDNRSEIGFNISQFQRDFGIGLQWISPYFMYQSLAIKTGINLLWLDNFNGTETTFTPYQNIQLGMRGRSANVSHHISIYGEGGVLLILPNSDFSSESTVFGGYGVFGFEFRVMPRFAYYIELGGVGTGATADKLPGKPIYSNGFLINVGLKLGL